MLELNKVHHGDCLEFLPQIKQLGAKVAVVSDPPYGGNYDTDYTRLITSQPEYKPGKPARNHAPVKGDDKPFDPVSFVDFEKVILFGYQHFAQRVPLGTILVWQKKQEYELNTFLSDAELAWQKGGQGVYIYKQRWNGFNRQGEERGQLHLHPTQKPIALMEWCIKRLKLSKDWIIFDPYAGSGSTLVAAQRLGYSYIGFEQEVDYVKIANERIEKEKSQPLLFAI